jgi:hypothetical protein
MSGVVCTMATGAYAELLDIARPGLDRMALSCDSDLVVVDRDLGDGRRTGWGKVAVLRELLDAYDVVRWVDADAVVVDSSADMAVELRPHQRLGLVFHRYDGMEIPNFGVLVMRSGRWAKRFLEELWSDERYVDHPWMENAPVLDRLGYEVGWPRRETRRFTADSLRTGRLDHSWNSVPAAPAASPRILHFPAMAHDERLVAMRAAASPVTAVR